jgi:hypothetical protein
MSTMIKLRLPASAATMSAVRALPGLEGIELDPKFGLVCIDPRRSLYVVRAEHMDELARRQKMSPEILGAYGDVRISATDKPNS